MALFKQVQNKTLELKEGWISHTQHRWVCFQFALSSAVLQSFEYRGREWFRGFLHSISTECLNQTLTNVFSLTLPEHLISPLRVSSYFSVTLLWSSQIYTNTGLYHAVHVEGHLVHIIRITCSLTHRLSQFLTLTHIYTLSYIHAHKHIHMLQTKPQTIQPAEMLLHIALSSLD